MLSMHRASALADRLRSNPTKIAEISRTAWSDGGPNMLLAVSDFAGVPLTELLRAGGLQKNWDRAVGTPRPLAHDQRRKHDGFHRPGARAEVRNASRQMTHEW